MKDYQEEFEKLQIFRKDYPVYNNPEDFARIFKRCSIYEYGVISYSNNSNASLESKDYNNA